MTPEEKVALLKKAGVWDVIGYPTCIDKLFDLVAAHEREKQAEQEPLMDYERINALREGEQNGAEDAYFFVRPENDTPSLRKMFCQGFERGFHKGLKYASPVRTKDLTDAELNKLLDYWSEDERSAYGGAWSADGEYVDMKSFARAVIAADREKNK
jgi:hypothetical protein